MKKLLFCLVWTLAIGSISAAPKKWSAKQEQKWSAMSSSDLGLYLASTKELCTFTRQQAKIAVAIAETGNDGNKMFAKNLLETVGIFCGRANALNAYIQHHTPEPEGF